MQPKTKRRELVSCSRPKQQRGQLHAAFFEYPSLRSAWRVRVLEGRSAAGYLTSTTFASRPYFLGGGAVGFGGVPGSNKPSCVISSMPLEYVHARAIFPPFTLTTSTAENFTLRFVAFTSPSAP